MIHNTNVVKFLAHQQIEFSSRSTLTTTLLFQTRPNSPRKRIRRPNCHQPIRIYNLIINITENTQTYRGFQKLETPISPTCSRENATKTQWASTKWFVGVCEASSQHVFFKWKSDGWKGILEDKTDIGRCANTIGFRKSPLTPKLIEGFKS